MIFAIAFGAYDVSPLWMKNGVTYRTYRWRLGPFFFMIGWHWGIAQYQEKRRKRQMHIRPLNDRVIVRRDDAEEKTPGGIIIPDNAKEKLTRGTVLSVGPGKLLENGSRVEPSVKAGDHIVFGKYSGSEFEQDNEKRIAMLEDDILGVIEEE